MSSKSNWTIIARYNTIQYNTRRINQFVNQVYDKLKFLIHQNIVLPKDKDIKLFTNIIDKYC